MACNELLLTRFLLIVSLLYGICAQNAKYKENTWNLHPEAKSTWAMDSKWIFVLMIIAVIGVAFLIVKNWKNLKIKSKSSAHVV